MKTTYKDQILTVYNRMDFTNLDEFEFRVWIEVDGVVTDDKTTTLSVAPHESEELGILYFAEECKYGAYLHASLSKDGKVYAEVQHELPCEIQTEAETKPVELAEEKDVITAKGERFAYTFSKHYGGFTSMVVDGEEQFAGRMQLSILKAPTDNERKMRILWLRPNVWEGENLEATFSKVYECYVENGEIHVIGSLAGVSRMPIFKYHLVIGILQDGTVKFALKGNVRENAIWLPRLGFEVELPNTSDKFTYYGHGPLESYCDMHHHAPVSMYESSADNEYVNYVRPQEHGNHYGVKMLKIGKLCVESDKGMECNVSKYSTKALLNANHTDELVADGNVHLRIDYKVSGIGSASCGHPLEEPYRLSEKEIEFAFTIRI